MGDQSGTIASMCKNLCLLLILGFVVALTQAGPQYKQPSSIYAKPSSNILVKPQLKPSSNFFGNLGNLGGGWTLGKIPGGNPAYGINYGKDNWKVGAGANGQFNFKPPYMKPTYIGVGAQYTFKGK